MPRSRDPGRGRSPPSWPPYQEERGHIHAYKKSYEIFPA